MKVSRKDIAFSLRALAQADIVQLLWTGISVYDAESSTYTISKRNVDGAKSLFF